LHAGQAGPGLGRLRRQLGHELGGRHPDRRRQPELAANLLADPATDRQAVAEQGARTAHVEKRLVQCDPLDERRAAVEDLMDLGADLAVAVVPAGHEHRMGAQSAGLGGRHGRVDSVGPGFVAGRRHHAPPAGTADDHRPSGQRRVEAHLDRREKGVHVDVKDRGHHRQSDRATTAADRF
jgi:hypothetical protein